MTEELPTQENLTKEIDTTSWSELAVHEERSALLMVDSSLNLAEVALKVALDDVESIKGWISHNLISRPTKDQLADFQASPTHKKFSFLIVQPYVLTQIKKDA
ncbi:MAG: DUF2288 family protein [Bacteriovoracaceae bacterium]|jgi:hypothetical protein|nr:DUF2288 family protein [Bacteriovoracaceae bacterium]